MTRVSREQDPVSEPFDPVVGFDQDLYDDDCEQGRGDRAAA